MAHREVRSSASTHPFGEYSSDHFGLRSDRTGSSLPAIEQLEARQLLSADLGPGGEWVQWGGGQVAAKAGSYVVTFDQYLGTQQADLMAREVATRLGISVTNSGGIGRGMFAWFEGAGAFTYEQAKAVVQQMPGLKGVEPDRLYQSTRVPNDPRFAEQYGLRNVGQPSGFLAPGTAGADIHAAEAWDITIGTRDAIVAVIDTGVNYNHPDLAQNIWVNPGEIPGNGIDDDGNGYVDDIHGFDFGVNDGDPMDEPSGGHGTPVAGSLGAVGNNGIGVTGVAWNVSIMALKIADAAGRLSSRAIVAAHDYATLMRERGINIVATNNSYGGIAGNFYDNEDDRPDLVAEQSAIERYLNAGGVFVASAGNSSLDNDSNLSAYPASFDLPGIIAVAATDNNDALADFSNYGVRTVDVAAPGVQILTTSQDGGYQFIDGTSFSGPIVAGAVALLKSFKPNASAVEIREALINGSDQIPALQGRIESGGRINIARSLQIIGRSGPVVRQVNPGPVSGQINPSDGRIINTVTINFSKDMDAAFFATSGVTLRGSGPDDIFGNPNDVIIPVTGVALTPGNARQVVITLNLNGFAGARLPVDTYRLTLAATTFRDTDGRFLNGNSTSGTDEVYNFRIVASTGDNETNDTLATATPVIFDAGGQANFQGVTLGNGLSGNLDVDIYRIDIPRGAFISAEIFAKRLTNPSTLDSYLRLFDANGQQLASNDQSAGSDSLINFFVNTGGTYYVGVSGFGNDRYNPNVAGSGATQSTGTYDLRMRVQIADDDVVSVASTDPNLPRRIPVDPAQTQGITTSTLTVTDSREIIDINVRLDISHTFTGDLEISLIAPDNTEVLLINRRGGNGDDFNNTLFDDEATLLAATGTAPFRNAYQPEQSLGRFDGKRGNGTWTLKVNDRQGLNSGTLNSWSLEFTFRNDIFGAFESNETIVTAFDLPGVSGSGSGQVQAFIGDGGFGSFDRDIFRFNAVAGSSLTAVVTPTAGANGAAATLNAALRLFTDQGVEIKLSNPTDSSTARIDNHIFAVGGTYFLAVSDGNNVVYNPTVVGDATSRPSATTGNYTLAVNLAAGVSDPEFVLRGNALDVGVDSAGRFGASDAAGNAGLVYNGIEFLANNIRFFGLTAAGNSFTNSQDGSQLPFSLTGQSDSFNNRVSTRSSFRGINVERTISFGLNDSFAAIDVYFSNIGFNTVSGITWMEGFNPDPGISLGDSGDITQTFNDVDAGGRMATARYVNNQFGQGLTVGLGASTSETRATATVLSGNFNVRDAASVAALPVNDPNGARTDDQLALTFALGDMAPNARTSIRYFIFFGTTPAQVADLYTQVNSGTGTGHLTADSANPATETLETGPGPVVTVPTLPYRVYYSEGFYGDNIFTFLPISNPNDQPTRVSVIARYEQGTRDQLVGELNIAANSRSGLTLLTPDLFRTGNALAGRTNPGGGVPAYALEIRSERPVAATFSHYDLNLVGGANVAIGEAFTTRVSTQWTFGEVTKGGGNSDFITFYNPNPETEKVTVRFYPLGGGSVITQDFYSINLDGSAEDGLAAYRRGGFAVNDIPGLADGSYGVTVECQVPIVAAVSHFNTPQQKAAGEVGSVGLGATSGVMPEGQFGLNAGNERIGVLNPGAATADVTFAFIFENGSAYRTLLTVPARQHGFINVADLPNFPTGLPYGVTYSSTQPVTVGMFSDAFSDGLASSFADRAFTVWGFGEGFRPGDNDNHPGVVEYLRIYNPSDSEVVFEVTITFDGTPGGETFRRSIPAKRVSDFNIDQFVTGSRRLNSAWYSLTVKAPTPIVAYMGHYDRVFPGGFGTLGTPLGASAPVT
ncbi:MAG: S8 family serine peptidase [Phycisphaerae bacterium]|nr:S8 family serine peptidase [Phycisphaerae bacterium]